MESISDELVEYLVDEIALNGDLGEKMFSTFGAVNLATMAQWKRRYAHGSHICRTQLCRQ